MGEIKLDTNLDWSELDTMINKDDTSIIKNSNDLLEQSIKIQKSREKKAYSILKTKENEEISFEDFKKALYYGKDKDQKDINKPEETIKILINFLNDLYTKDIDSSIPKGGEIIRAKQILSDFNNITETFRNWYYSNNNITQEEIEKNEGLPLESIIKLEKIWNTEINTTVFKKLKLKDSYNIYNKMEQDENFVMTPMMAKEIISQYKNKKNDMAGLIGEAATQYCLNSGINLIVTQTARREDNSKEINDRISKYEQGYKDKLSDNKKELIEQFKEMEKNNSFLGDDFELKVSSELKSDEIFEVKIDIGYELNENGTFTFGVSNKTSHTENKLLKIQETSLMAIIQNLYKVDPELRGYTNEIVKALKELTAFGAIILKWDKNLIPFEGYKTIVNNIVNKYAYVWFTEGDSSYSHADFFSVYKSGHLYFLPMSSILEKIKSGQAKFDNIKLYKYFYSEKEVFTKEREQRMERLLKELEEKKVKKVKERAKIPAIKTELSKRKIQDQTNKVLRNKRKINLNEILKRNIDGNIFMDVINAISIPSPLSIGNFYTLT